MGSLRQLGIALDVRYREVEAGLGQRQCDGTADSTAGPGDQGDRATHDRAP
ncbi:hypothetical protein D3C78_1529200 [compost metagenome]